MDCPNCRAGNTDDRDFCRECGAPLTGGVQPTTRMPVAGINEVITPPLYGAPPTAPPPPPVYGTPAAPAKKGGKTLVIVLIVVALLTCCCITAGGAGAFWWTQKQKTDTPIALDEDDSDGGGESSAVTDSEQDGTFDTAEEAVRSVLTETDWIVQLDTDDGDTRTYLVGPPQSEWAGSVVVGRQGDGWVVIEDGQSDAGAGDSGDSGDELNIDEMKAYDTVKAFLGWVLQDDGLEAQKLTVEPFRNDSASAQVSAGGLTDYVIEDVTTNSDGTYDVIVSETWYGETETYTYKVKDTSAGLRIFDLSVQ